jgi:DNA-binding NarL/FixJ family response regulator
MPLRKSVSRDEPARIPAISTDDGESPDGVPGMLHEWPNVGAGRQPLTVAVASSDPQLVQHLAAAAAAHAELRWLGALDLQYIPRPEHPAARARILIIDQALLVRARSPLTDPRAFADASKAKLVLVADQQDPTLPDRLVALHASGCLPPRVDSPTLLKALRAVDKGELWFPRHIANTLYERMLAEAAGGETAPISPKVRAVLDLAASGLTNKEISLRLGISLSTVKKHLHNGLERRGLHRRRQLLG